MASLSQGRTAAAQCSLFTHKSVPVISEPPCIMSHNGMASIKYCITLHLVGYTYKNIFGYPSPSVDPCKYKLLKTLKSGIFRVED